MNQNQQDSLNRAEKALEEAQAEIAKIKAEIKKEEPERLTKDYFTVGRFFVITNTDVKIACRINSLSNNYLKVVGIRNGVLYEGGDNVMLDDPWKNFRLPKSIEDFKLIEEFLLKEAEESGIRRGDVLRGEREIYPFENVFLDALKMGGSAFCNEERAKLGHRFFLNVSSDIYTSPLSRLKKLSVGQEIFIGKSKSKVKISRIEDGKVFYNQEKEAKDFGLA